MDLRKLKDIFQSLQTQLECNTFVYKVSEDFSFKLKLLSNVDEMQVVNSVRERLQAATEDERTDIYMSVHYINITLSKAIQSIIYQDREICLTSSFISGEEEGQQIPRDQALEEILSSLPLGIPQAIYHFYMDAYSKHTRKMESLVSDQTYDPEMEIERLKATISDLENQIAQQQIDHRLKYPLETVEETVKAPVPPSQEEEVPNIDPSAFGLPTLNPDLTPENTNVSEKNPRFKR